MRIGILTFHYTINPGSVLQAYCLQKILMRKHPNAVVEIINLIPYNRELNELISLRRRIPFIDYESILKYVSIRKFVNDNLILSKKALHRNIDKQIDFINSLNYDYIITGSDTVFMYSPKLDNMLPSIYYLPKGVKSNKISFAASLDPLKDRYVFKKNKSILKSIFDEYSIVTVRDTITYEILNDIGVNNIKYIADPTILYDFEKDFNINTSISNIVKKQNIVIWTGSRELNDKLKVIIDDSNGATISVKPKVNYHSHNYICDYLSSYKDIDVLITDRYHKSIFALKLSNALVINIERNDKNIIDKGKGWDLFNRIGINEYFIRYDGNNVEYFKSKLINTINDWDEQALNKRNEMVNKYIVNQKAILDNIYF